MRQLKNDVNCIDTKRLWKMSKSRCAHRVEHVERGSMPFDIEHVERVERVRIGFVRHESHVDACRIVSSLMNACPLRDG